MVKLLFSFYFSNIEELPNDFYEDFIFRTKRLTFRRPAIYKKYVANLEADGGKIKSTVETLYNELEHNSSLGLLPKNDIRKILKMFNRSLAIHISKMTDNYAKHKYKKYIK